MSCVMHFGSPLVLVLVCSWPNVTPFCALQACMEDIQLVVIEIVVLEIDILASSTGNFNISVEKLKNSAFVGNTGHFDNEIDLAGS